MIRRSRWFFRMLAPIALVLLFASTLTTPSSPPLTSATPLSVTVPSMKLPWEAGTSYSFSGAPHGVNTVYECATSTDASNLIRDLSLISGLDFGIPENTDVLAVASGTVIFAGDGTNLKPKPEGSAVGIDHGDGFATFYWHLNSIDPTLLNDFNNGRTVKVSQGTYLGESGGSGNPRQIHLHLEFHNWPADTPYPAHGISIGGYTARSFVLQSDNTKGLNYQGTMTRGSETQVPHSYCGEPVTKWTGSGDGFDNNIGTVEAGSGQLLSIQGDINNDNRLDILDYNLLLDCYSDLLAAENCNEEEKQSADLNDDGNVNQLDYNIMVRAFCNLPGNSTACPVEE